MNHSVKILSLFGGALLLMTSCLKPTKFPPEPEISFNSFEIRGDSAVVTVNFQDGDGDIGLNDFDTVAPYDTASIFYYNFFMEYWEKDDALGWVQGLDFNGDPVSFNYRIPLITPSGQNKALKGEVEVVIEPLAPGFPAFYNLGSSESDTIQYRIRLADRALNLSNQVYSPEVMP